MYIKLEEAILVHPSKYRPMEGDSVAYRRELNGETVFTLTGEASKYDGKPVERYGMLYTDTAERICLVPDIWDENDAMCARSAVWPDMPVEEVQH